MKYSLSKEEQENKDRPKKSQYKPVVGIAVISLLICGLFFPLLVTAVGQVMFPYQANGEIKQLNGKSVGSILIDNGFSLPIFFHARPANQSASGVDPDITMQDAYSQIPRISNATGISATDLNNLVNRSTEGKYWIFGTPYVNVLNLNLQLIHDFPNSYKNYTSSG